MAQSQNGWRPEEARGDSFLLCLLYAVAISLAIGFGYGVAEGVSKGLGALCLAFGALVMAIALALKTFAILQRWQRVPDHVLHIRELLEKWQAEGVPVEFGGMPTNVRRLNELAEKWERDGLPIAFSDQRTEQPRAEER